MCSCIRSRVRVVSLFEEKKIAFILTVKQVRDLQKWYDDAKIQPTSYDNARAFACVGSLLETLLSLISETVRLRNIEKCSTDLVKKTYNMTSIDSSYKKLTVIDPHFVSVLEKALSDKNVEIKDTFAAKKRSK